MSTFPRLIRPARDEDAPFIVNAWLNGDGVHRHQYEHEVGYRDAQREVIRHLLRSSTVLMAVLPPEAALLLDPPPEREVYLGFAAGERHRNRLVLHYCYTKSAYRKDGLANALLDVLRGTRRDTYVTHITHPWVEHYVRRRGWPRVTAAPYIQTILSTVGVGSVTVPL